MLAADPEEPSTPTETTNTCACIALFSALLGLVPIAVVFALIAWSETGRRDYERGAGMAVAALLLTTLQLAVLGVLLWRLELPPFGGWTADLVGHTRSLTPREHMSR